MLTMWRVLTGLVMVSAAIVMLVIARPRNDEAIGFLRGRGGLVEAYIVVVVMLLFLGGMLVIG